MRIHLEDGALYARTPVPDMSASFSAIISAATASGAASAAEKNHSTREVFLYPIMILIPTLTVAFLITVLILVKYMKWTTCRAVPGPVPRPRRRRARDPEKPLVPFEDRVKMLDNVAPEEVMQNWRSRKEATDSRIAPRSAQSLVCAICLETMEVDESIREIRCMHLYHTSCLNSWFGGGHDECPLCKCNMAEVKVTAESESDTESSTQSLRGSDAV